MSAAVSGGGNRRRGGSGAGRRGRTDATLPDEYPHAIGRLNRRKLHVRPRREHGVSRQGRAKRVEAVGGRKRSKDHALRIACAQQDGGDRVSQDGYLHLTDVRRLTHVGPELIALAFPAQKVEGLEPGLAVDCDADTRLETLDTGDQGGKASQPIPRQLGPASIRIQQAHRRPTLPQRVEDHSVGADSRVTVTHGSRQRRQIAPWRVLRHQQEIVAVGVAFDDVQGTEKALKT